MPVDEETTHLVQLREDGWTLQHPLSCRPTLFTCEVNQAATLALTEPPATLGVFECGTDGGRFVIGAAR
nr:DUF6085 family protein [Micromonospora sp. HNM0581]